MGLILSILLIMVIWTLFLLAVGVTSPTLFVGAMTRLRGESNPPTTLSLGRLNIWSFTGLFPLDYNYFCRLSYLLESVSLNFDA